MIKKACLELLWQYFNLDSKVVFIKLIKPITLLGEATPETLFLLPRSSIKSSQTATEKTVNKLKAKETKNARALDNFLKLFNIWHIEKKE